MLRFWESRRLGSNNYQLGWHVVNCPPVNCRPNRDGYRSEAGLELFAVEEKSSLAA